MGAWIGLGTKPVSTSLEGCAAAHGHLDHYSPSDKAKLLRGKKGI
jgi:hypothetical protein